MTAGSERTDRDDRSAVLETRPPSNRRRSSGCESDDSWRLVTDGGQTMADEDESSEEANEDESSEDNETEADADDGSESETEADESEQEGAESDEGASEEESEEEESEEEASEEESEEEESEEEASEEESEEEESEEEASEEESEEDEEDEYHVEDADDVYEGDDTSGVLHLDLDGLFLDLLGLEVNLNPVTLDVSARPGENNLLGNLLSAVSGLLDGPSAVLNKVTSLLGKPKSWLKSAWSRITGWFKGIANKPREFVAGLFGRGEGEEGEQTDAEDEESEGGVLSSALGWIRGLFSSAAGRLKEGLASLVPSLPIEEIIATLVREVVRELVQQLEPDGKEQGEQQDADAEQAEAGS
ncbi:hypothetical protein [Natrarchaeobius chitinivorans]|nr:hypothetical protein [Natrarchaeobius chitinivorans]